MAGARDSFIDSGTFGLSELAVISLLLFVAHIYLYGHLPFYVYMGFRPAFLALGAGH